MELKKEKELEMLAYEAFIHRAAEVDLPFMLKGSYVTRQYFPDPMDRIPADLDWVYLEKLSDEIDAKRKFNKYGRGAELFYQAPGKNSSIKREKINGMG